MNPIEIIQIQIDITVYNSERDGFDGIEIMSEHLYGLVSLEDEMIIVHNKEGGNANTFKLENLTSGSLEEWANSLGVKREEVFSFLISMRNSLKEAIETVDKECPDSSLN